MDVAIFSVKQLQNWMQGMLVQHVPVVDGVSGIAANVEDLINSSARLGAAQHLNIYRHSYIARLREVMRNQFSALAFALGSELFESFADQYLDVCPSGSYTLNTLGEKFPAFLQDTRPDAGQEEKETWPDFMIELAGFEYALSVIFDEQASEKATVSQPDTPDELLKLAPVFHLFHHQFPICDYYLAFTQKKEPELPFPEDSFCVVTRLNYRLGLFPIKAAQYYFLQAMQQGASVAGSKEALVRSFGFEKPAVDNIWPEWKKNFIASGFFCS